VPWPRIIDNTAWNYLIDGVRRFFNSSDEVLIVDAYGVEQEQQCRRQQATTAAKRKARCGDGERVARDGSVQELIRDCRWL